VLFLVSAAVLADEVVLVRAFSFGLWHHFAYMVISIALLGFGASGTLLAVLVRARTRWGTGYTSPIPRAAWLAAAVLFALTLPVSFELAQKIPFDPFLIVWERQQFFYLGCYYLVLFVPFFAAATVIGLALITESDESPRLYFYNLIGSAAGAALGVGFLEIVPVEHAVLAVTGLAQAAAVFALLVVATPLAAQGNRRIAVLAVLPMAALTFYYAIHPPEVRLSHKQHRSNSPGRRQWPCGLVPRIAGTSRRAPGRSRPSPGKLAPGPHRVSRTAG